MLEALTDGRAIALTITLLEGVCLVYIRRFVSLLEGSQRSQLIFAARFGSLFLCLAWAFIWGESAYFGPLMIDYGLPPSMYRILLWDFFAALMAAFDCLLFYYAMRTLSLLKSKPGSPGGWLLVLMITFVISSYWIYYSHAVELYRVGAVDAPGFLAVSDFFRRICSMYFILLEAAIAGLGLLIYGRVGQLAEECTNG